MGLSIFYSMSMLAEPAENVLNGLHVLRCDVTKILETHFPTATVSEISRLTGREMGLVQTDPKHPLWGFCRQAGRPIGVRPTLPLGVLPEYGITFTVQTSHNFEFPLGICQYAPSVPIALDWLGGKSEQPYDERWFFYNYCDPMNRLNRSIVRAALEMARRTGFEEDVNMVRNLNKLEHWKHSRRQIYPDSGYPSSAAFEF